MLVFLLLTSPADASELSLVEVDPAVASVEAVAASASGSTGSSPTSVTAHITCSSKVKVFRGSSSGSGTTGWEEPNHTVSWSIRSGEQVCVVDGGGRRVGCWSPSGQARADVNVSCSGVSAR